MSYFDLYHPDRLDYLSNAEYKTLLAEPTYSLLVALYKILPKDMIQLINQYNPSQIPVDLTGRTIRRLDNSIEAGQFKEFQSIYDTEYMCNPSISNFFEFVDQSRYPTYFNYYDLCSCRNCCNDDYFQNFSGNLPCNLCEPKMISRNFYVKECKCQNGKRFLAFQMIYRFAYEIIDIDINQRNKGNKERKGKKGKRKRIDQNKYNKPFQLMIDHVIESGPIDLEFNPVIEENN
jgi:hypothetical protein